MVNLCKALGDGWQVNVAFPTVQDARRDWPIYNRYISALEALIVIFSE